MTIQPKGTEIGYQVTWLEMTRRPAYDWPHQPAGEPATLTRADAPPVWYFLALYRAVGRDYAWEDLLEGAEERLAAWLSDDAVSLWTLTKKGWPHGFFILDSREAGVTDIAYFGLVPEAVGAGLGTYLLRTAILTAWEKPGTRKLTVNTCTLDHPRALAAYQKAGFTPVRREEKTRILTRDRDLSRIPD